MRRSGFLSGGPAAAVVSATMAASNRVMVVVYAGSPPEKTAAGFESTLGESLSEETINVVDVRRISNADRDMARDLTWQIFQGQAATPRLAWIRRRYHASNALLVRIYYDTASSQSTQVRAEHPVRDIIKYRIYDLETARMLTRGSETIETRGTGMIAQHLWEIKGIAEILPSIANRVAAFLKLNERAGR